VAEGERGEAAKGERGEAAEGERGEVAKGERGEAAEGGHVKTGGEKIGGTRKQGTLQCG
jgi:hypothetical protein